MSDAVQTVQKAIDEQQKKNAPMRLECIPSEFPTQTKGHITSTIEIAKKISDVFSVFSDYAGCKVYPYMGQAFPELIRQTMILGNFYVDLYFEKGAGDKDGFENLELINGPDNSDALDRLKSVCGGPRNHSTYKVNKDTLDMLSEFVPGYNPNGNSANPMWNMRIVEELMSAGPYSNHSKISVRIIGLVVDAVMNQIYGVIDPDDEKVDKKGNKNIRYDYHCIPIATSMNRINAYSNVQPGVNMNLEQEYVVQVLQNDRSIISTMQKAIGLTNTMPGGNYVPRNM